MDYEYTDTDLDTPTGTNARTALSTDEYEYEVEDLNEPISNSDSDLDIIPTMRTSQGRILLDTRMIESQSTRVSVSSHTYTYTREAAAAAVTDPDPTTTTTTVAELGADQSDSITQVRTRHSLTSTQASLTYPEYPVVQADVNTHSEPSPTHPESAIRARGSTSMVEDESDIGMGIYNI
jgi:hypothetical protein